MALACHVKSKAYKKQCVAAKPPAACCARTCARLLGLTQRSVRPVRFLAGRLRALTGGVAPHTQLDAEAAAGMAPPDNGRKLR